MIRRWWRNRKFKKRLKVQASEHTLPIVDSIEEGDMVGLVNSVLIEAPDPSNPEAEVARTIMLHKTKYKITRIRDNGSVVLKPIKEVF